MFTLQQFIDEALKEDIGDGDHTTLACVSETQTGSAEIIAKETGIIAGVVLADQIFTRFDATLKVQTHVADGEKIAAGTICITVSGKIRSILTCERLVLNCMQRMSGIATQTKEMCERISGLNTKILDTRKTTPLFRMMEKWAVKIGGGENHRFGLYDMILIKNNHVDSSGGITNAIRSASEYLKAKNKKLRIVVETRNMSEVNDVLNYGNVNRILLDNFSPAQLTEAVKQINHRFETEASGKITPDNVRQYAETGVDFISAGSLTHSYKSMDISLRITK
ncbi:MAG TPA: carboxylating nicotinate-nucleotide diphosphorylase [Bacteroidia bacterium]|nr:carboxylating nicotinate-nucleotide diphosphorylase [Bacteroidia bacterium]